MAKGTRYSAEFKQEAVNQITVHDYPVAEVAERLGVSGVVDQFRAEDAVTPRLAAYYPPA